ncbi:uncharacterized protein LOC141898258, partial [Tubulanus polymorphus]|uniref:uncharacterized protein LOC141898258 n=1 Tax=Tubulanus polymorphus TaxID=672921 RepID=UPI003DA544CF
SAGSRTTTKRNGITCLDWKGGLIENGAQFVPHKKDLCTACMCDHGYPTTCKSVLCSPPTSCPVWEQLPGECCKFTCINSTVVFNKPPTTGGGDVDTNPDSPASSGETTNIGLRLVASTVTSFLILALLLFMIHRVRRRRMLFTMRRMNNNCRRETAADMVATAYVSEYDEINIGVEFPPYSEPPPPYSPPRANRVPGEAPPPYESCLRRDSNETGERRRNGAVAVLPANYVSPVRGNVAPRNNRRRDSSSSDTSTDSVFVRRNVARNSVGTITDAPPTGNTGTNNQHCSGGDNNANNIMLWRQSNQRNDNQIRIEREVARRCEVPTRTRWSSSDQSYMNIGSVSTPESIGDNHHGMIDTNRNRISYVDDVAAIVDNRLISEPTSQQRVDNDVAARRQRCDDNNPSSGVPTFSSSQRIDEASGNDSDRNVVAQSDELSDGSIVLEDSQDRKVIWQTGENDDSSNSDRVNRGVVKPDGLLLSPSRFRISDFLRLQSSNDSKRHSSYDSDHESSPSHQSHRYSLPPMSLSFKPQLNNPRNYAALPSNGASIHSPEVYPGATNFHSPISLVGSSCSPSHNSGTATAIQSPITPGTPLHNLGRSSSVTSQMSFASICSETGEPRTRWNPGRAYLNEASSPASSGSHDSDYVQDVSVQVGASIEQLNHSHLSPRNHHTLPAPRGAVGGARPKTTHYLPRTQFGRSRSLNRLSEEMSDHDEAVGGECTSADNQLPDSNGNLNTDKSNVNKEKRWVRHAQLGDRAVKKQYGFIDLPSSMNPTSRSHLQLSFVDNTVDAKKASDSSGRSQSSDPCNYDDSKRLTSPSASRSKSMERKDHKKRGSKLLRNFVKSKSSESIARFVRDSARSSNIWQRHLPSSSNSNNNNNHHNKQRSKGSPTKRKYRHSSNLEQLRKPHNSTGADLYHIAAGVAPPIHRRSRSLEKKRRRSQQQQQQQSATRRTTTNDSTPLTSPVDSNKDGGKNHVFGETDL